jgi:long-subunit acyl-CoA synthetase (AMP-forming)
VYYCDDPRAAADALPVARPHIFFAPPRFWEKMRDAIEARWARLPPAEHARLADALQAHTDRVRLEQAGEKVPAEMAAYCAQTDLEWFAPLRGHLGLDTENAYRCSGGIAAPPALLTFFYAIGLPLDEVYGQTESSALGTRCPREGVRMGTVGVAQPGIEIELAEDGELLIRSPAIMRGYRKMPELTASTIDSRGWLHTGDIARVDTKGYYQIVDRKKEMIINSFGKNMSPANIEAALTSAGPFISQAVVIGDARPYNVALLTLDKLQLTAWIAQHDIHPHIQPNELVQDPRLLSEVGEEVRRANEQLSRVEQIKKFHMFVNEWLPGAPELTPTMKLKRQVIREKYAAEIEAMYKSGRA